MTGREQDRDERTTVDRVVDTIRRLVPAHREARPFVVRRVHTKNGSHIEPPLNPKWSDLDKLGWAAAVLREDTGVDLRVTDYGTNYCLSYHGGSMTVGTYESAWAVINGVTLGARLTRHGGDDA